MSSDLISIARTGANAARLALDVTAQNIANAGTDGYVRRTVSLSEVVGTGGSNGGLADPTLAGVRLSGIVRNADDFRTSEVRRTGGDLARADAELDALNNIEASLEQSGVGDALTAFKSSLQGLQADPTNPALRATVMENAKSLVGSLNTASAGLASAQSDLYANASAGVTQLNQLAASLAKLNSRLLRSTDGSSDQAALLDQRDSVLQSMSQIAGVSVTIGDHQTADVAIGGVALAATGTAASLNIAAAPDGSLAFDIGGTPAAPSGGSLAGINLGLQQLIAAKGRLDDVAGAVIGAVNTAQASGVALDGSAGQPLFSGSTASDIALATSDGTRIATASAGSAAGSRNTGNLNTLLAALDGSGAASSFDQLLTDVSGTVASRGTMRDSLSTIADGAKSALASQAGVSLDDEAANLLRYQQAFQASGRIMQVAKDLFDTILSIR